MTENYPITPPPELVQQWGADWYRSKEEHSELEPYLVAKAAQWGADQELEACCEWLQVQDTRSAKWFDPRHDACALAGDLRTARRSKPPSLKEEALAALHGADDQGLTHEHVVTIRRALEKLDD